MSETSNRPLRVFLCHSSNDKPLVRELYQKLRAEDWIQPWLDEEELYPGQDWNFEIEKAVEAADVILVCLSNNSVNKEGYVQRELRLVLDYADYKPEGTLYIIPVRLEKCEPPRRLRPWQYADYFPKEGRARAFQRLLVSLKRRADSLGLEAAGRAGSPMVSPPKTSNPISSSHAESVTSTAPAVGQIGNLTYANKSTLRNGMEFMRVPAGLFLMGSTKENKSASDVERPQHTVDIAYDFWMARFPLTNELYNAYVRVNGIKHPVDDWEKKKDHPVVSVSWIDATAYCLWLQQLPNDEPFGYEVRLPTEAEWEKAARWNPPTQPFARFARAGISGANGLEWPWGNEFGRDKCNSVEAGRGETTPVGLYSPSGDSPCGCADMAGNVWEWTNSLFSPYPYMFGGSREKGDMPGARVLRGGAFNKDKLRVRCAYRSKGDPSSGWNFIGFRVVIAPPIDEIIKLLRQ